MILDKKHALQQKLFRQFAETEFTKEILDELEETGEFNWEMHKKMAQYGFMGVKIPKEYTLRQHIQFSGRRPAASCRQQRAERKISAAGSKRREDSGVRLDRARRRI